MCSFLLSVDFDNLVKETAEFNNLQQKLMTLEGKPENGKPRVESSKTSQKADKRSASRSFSMPFQQVVNTNSDERYQESKAKASNIFESATQPKAPGPIQRPSNASNQTLLNSFYGDDSSVFGKNLLWSDNILFSNLANNSNDPVAHLNLKSTNTSDDDLVLLSKDPNMENLDSGAYNSTGLKFNEFRLFGNTPTEPSKSALGADLLNNILSTSSIWPAGGDQENSSGDKSSNAPWNSILLDDYQCSPLAPDDGTGIKFDFPDIKSEDKLKSIWSDIGSSEDKETETTKEPK